MRSARGLGGRARFSREKQVPEQEDTLEEKINNKYRMLRETERTEQDPASETEIRRQLERFKEKERARAEERMKQEEAQRQEEAQKMMEIRKEVKRFKERSTKEGGLKPEDEKAPAGANAEQHKREAHDRRVKHEGIEKEEARTGANMEGLGQSETHQKGGREEATAAEAQFNAPRPLSRDETKNLSAQLTKEISESRKQSVDGDAAGASDEAHGILQEFLAEQKFLEASLQPPSLPKRPGKSAASMKGATSSGNWGFQLLACFQAQATESNGVEKKQAPPAAPWFAILDKVRSPAKGQNQQKARGSV